MSEELLIRLAEPRDMKNIFDLSNDPTVRANSIHTEQIKWEDHVKWYQKALSNQLLKFYIIEDSNHNFIGQIRFAKEDEGWITSISIRQEFRGKGIAASALIKALQMLKQYPVFAEIKENNLASAKSFTKAGFSLYSEKNINNIKYKVFKYEK